MRHYRADPTFSTNLIIYLRAAKSTFCSTTDNKVKASCGVGSSFQAHLAQIKFGSSQHWLKSKLAQNKFGKNQIWHTSNLAQIKCYSKDLSVKFNTLKVRSFIQRLKYSDFLITLIHDPDRDDPAEEGDGSILDGHVGGLARLADLYSRSTAFYCRFIKSSHICGPAMLADLSIVSIVYPCSQVGWPIYIIGLLHSTLDHIDYRQVGVSLALLGRSTILYCITCELYAMCFVCTVSS